MQLIKKIHTLMCTDEVLIILINNEYYIGTIERFEFSTNCSDMRLIIKTGSQSQVSLGINELFSAQIFHSIDELQDYHSKKIEETKSRFKQLNR